MEQPMVSVIMPAYNCTGYIDQAIASVIAQNVDWELLVIDDGSKDKLDSVMEKYKQDTRIHYLKNEKNMGVSATRNRGVELAKGKYIAFLDSDDCWTEGKLEKQVEILEKDRGAVLCSTARQLMDPDGTVTDKVIQVKSKITYQELLHHNSIACSSVLIRREVMQKVPMVHDDSHEDYIAWLKILKDYGYAVGLSEPFLIYRLSTSGKSGNKFKSAKMTFQVYRYMGFGILKSSFYFVLYAINGVKKYM